jgi:Alkaline phosphatase PhoX
MQASALRGFVAILAAGLTATTIFVVAGAASSPDLTTFTHVAAANPKAPGFAAPNILSPELTEAAVAQGSMRLENGTAAVPFYGYDGDGTLVPLPGTNAEATKTEPDKNTYLVMNGLKGADPGYNYGTHFLFQGHESGSPGYITRVNLDADGAHRVTLLATADASGPLPSFDGSTWDPWAKRLLFTSEFGAKTGVWQATLDVPATVEDISGALGRGGYEAIQNDSDGNIWLVEDIGGANGTGANNRARQPNSFIYRFVPGSPSDLTTGKLQALQVISLRTGQPIVFHAGQADADILSDDMRDLHTYGKVFQTHWVTVHDTATDGTTPFNSNALAKTRGATPFKRPENGQFRPGSHFTEFYFDETGDTNALSSANADFGGWGAILKLTQASPSADTGTLTMFFKCNQAHSGFDNTAFFTRDQVAFVEDAGDTLHTQRNALDSAYLFDVTTDYSNPANQPVRFLAQGRDASATIDSGLLGSPGFQNEGDNEITGIHVSDGDPGPHGILGDRIPMPFNPDGHWRVFYTQQHGDNVTYELRRG